MKHTLSFLLISLVAVLVARGQGGALAPADREALLERLEQIREAAESRIDARYRTAISAYRTAMTSDEATYSFYMKCVEKVDFEDQNLRAQEFRDWRRRNDERLKDPAFRRALRYQLRWLVLTLQAASENADRASLVGTAQEVLEGIFQDASSFAGHQNILRQPVTGSVFARAYEIEGVRVEDWVMAPGRVGEIYDRILLPPLRASRNAEALRSGWTRRIQQELIAIEQWPGESNPRGGRIGMASAMRGPEYDRFMVEEMPRLQWSMEVDVFNHGDPGGAAVRMLAHIERHATHASVREWTAEFEGLLRPQPSAARVE